MEYPKFDSYSVIGINHRDAPVEIREKFCLDAEKKMELLDEARRQGISSLFIISTCNRTEIVARETTLNILIRLLTNYSGGSPEEFHKFGFAYKGRRAIEHLFNVSTGLDSQILGDLQIIKQVKEGYEFSVGQNMIDGEMHRLIQSVFRAHKRSRSETSLGQGAATVAYAAVKFACCTFRSLHDKKILLVGTGKLGTITCKNLLSMGAKNLTLVNRTRDHAEFLAGRFDLEVADMEFLPQQIANADLVIVSTGSNKPIITMDHMQKSQVKRKFKVMLDLSVPRNIESKVGELEFVDLANMDMFSDATDRAYLMRENEIPLVEKIIEKEIEDYEAWLSEQNVVPAIKALMDELATIRDSELEFMRDKISSADVDKMENLARRVVNKIAAFIIEYLKGQPHCQYRIEVVEEMFKLTVEKESQG